MRSFANRKKKVITYKFFMRFFRYYGQDDLTYIFCVTLDQGHNVPTDDTKKIVLSN